MLKEVFRGERTGQVNPVKPSFMPLQPWAQPLVFHVVYCGVCNRSAAGCRHEFCLDTWCGIRMRGVVASDKLAINAKKILSQSSQTRSARFCTRITRRKRYQVLYQRRQSSETPFKSYIFLPLFPRHWKFASFLSYRGIMFVCTTTSERLCYLCNWNWPFSSPLLNFCL